MTGHYFQDWLLLETDWNWRLEPGLGGALRAVGDIGSHWLDLVTFITGLRITEVMADLHTFIPTRQQPTGPVETFSTERAADTVEREIGTEDAAMILCASRMGPAGRCPSARSARAARTRSSTRLMARRRRWPGTPSSRTSCGSVIGSEPNQILIRDPALMGSAGKAAAFLPGGHVEGFADTFRALFSAIYADVGEGRPAERPRYPTFPDGHDEMLVGDAVAASSRDGRWAAVDRDV